MQGWIKLHRDLLDKPIWIESTLEQKTILITLLMLASHKENKWEWQGKLYNIEPGQFITSLESIAEKCGKGVSIQNVRTALKRFEKYEFLTNKSTNKNRLITIVNWGVYQGNEEELTNKLTGNQQATNKQLTTIKNVKNEKNVKEKDYTSKIKDLFPVFSSIPNFIELNKQYWDVVRETRATGKISPSVIYRTMEKWQRFDPVIVHYALKTHIEAHEGKKEEYTIGIMRGTTKEEAQDRLNRKKNPSSKQASQQLDPRDIEIAANKWVAAGNDPKDFNWETGHGIIKE